MSQGFTSPLSTFLFSLDYTIARAPALLVLGRRPCALSTFHGHVLWTSHVPPYSLIPSLPL